MVRPKRLAVAGDKPGQVAYRESLLWWQARLTEGLLVPLAPRAHFPTPGAPGCAVVCTDAAREAGTGLGGYAPVEVGGELVFFYIEARWPEHIILALQENRISMPAGELFTMVVAIVAITITDTIEYKVHRLLQILFDHLHENELLGEEIVLRPVDEGAEIN